MKDFTQLAWKEFLYGGHLQCLGSAGIVWLSSLLLEIPITWDILVVVYLLIYPIYVYNRITELKNDALTNLARTEYLSKAKTKLQKLFFLFLVLPVAGLLFFAKLPAIIGGILILLFGILYTVYFKKLTKYIVGFKNYFVASVFALFIFAPFAYYGYSLKPVFAASLVLSLWVFAKCVVMQIILDLKDIESDRRQNLQTIPVVVGREKTLVMLPWITLFITIPIPLFFTLWIPLFPQEALALEVSIVPVLYVLYLARKELYQAYLIESSELTMWPILITLWRFLS